MRIRGVSPTSGNLEAELMSVKNVHYNGSIFLEEPLSFHTRNDT